MIRHSCLILFSLLTLNSLVSAEVYRTTNEQGVTVFTDQPAPDATAVDIQPTNNMPAEAPPPTRKQEPTDQNAIIPQINLVSPENQSTFQNPEVVYISARISPGLQQGQQVLFTDQGQALSPASSATSLSIEYMDRGTHRIQAHIIDAKGTKLASSQIIEFYVHRASVLN